MTMFTQIEALLGQFGLSSITMSSIGDELVVTVRPSGGEVANAIKQPLVLTATAVELDEGFGAALDQWAGIRTNIKDQLDAQAAEMEEAKKAAASKPKVAAAPKSAPKAATTLEALASGDDDEGCGDDEDGCGCPVSPAPTASATAPAVGGDLSDLL